MLMNRIRFAFASCSAVGLTSLKSELTQEFSARPLQMGANSRRDNSHNDLGFIIYTKFEKKNKIF